MSFQRARRGAFPFALGTLLVLPGTLALPGLSEADVAKTPVQQFQAEIQPMLEDHCYECHGDGHDKGKVAFDELDTDAQVLDISLWQRVLMNTRAGLMPAEQKPKLSPADQAKLENWIKTAVFRIDPANPDPGRVTVRRLNRVEYRNTIRDLMGVDFNTDEEFPADDTGYGFDNIGDALTLSPMLMEKYVAAAQEIVNEAVPTEPREPATQEITGAAFKVADGTAAHSQVRGDKLRLSYLEPARLAAAVTAKDAGDYTVTLELDVRGNFVFDPATTHVVVKIDGQEMLNRDFAYFNERSFTFDANRKWTAGEHAVTVELTPVKQGEKADDPTRLVIDKLTVRGPLEKNLWVATKNYDKYFPRAIPEGRAQRRIYARELLGAFATRAYRRPLTDDTAERLAALAESVYSQKGKSFEQGVRHAMAAVLASPHFLFRLEEPVPATQTRQVALVDEYSLASRLSYFLWSTMPDSELIDLASRNELRKNLSAQVERMLADPRAESLSKNFTGQWLEARDVPGIASNAREILVRDAGEEDLLKQLIGAFRSGNRDEAKRLAGLVDAAVKRQGERAFGKDIELNGELRSAMRSETEQYFAYVVKEDRPVTELIDSNYTFLNEKLAKLYDVPGVTGPEMRKVTLPPGSPRGGVLTQGTALVVTSNPDRTSPVKRGLFVLANFLGTPPPPPPPNIPALEASDMGHDGRQPTLRETLAKHRENPSCASCHQRMDPIGLAFENFNALGMWRDSERKQPIVAPGKLVTGEEFGSVSELKKILATRHREDFYRTLTDKLLTYATGRGTEYYDVETIDEIVRRLDDNDGRFSAMLMGIIESAPFQKMRTQATATVAN